MSKQRRNLGLILAAVFLAGLLPAWGGLYVVKGYYYDLHSTESFPFLDGRVKYDTVIESTGIPFLDPSKSILTIENGSAPPIIVYKAKRVFQESSPVVRDLSVEANRITWRDGLHTYQLVVDPIEDSERRHR